MRPSWMRWIADISYVEKATREALENLTDGNKYFACAIACIAKQQCRTAMKRNVFDDRTVPTKKKLIQANMLQPANARIHKMPNQFDHLVVGEWWRPNCIHRRPDKACLYSGNVEIVQQTRLLRSAISAQWSMIGHLHHCGCHRIHQTLFRIDYWTYFVWRTWRTPLPAIHTSLVVNSFLIRNLDILRIPHFSLILEKMIVQCQVLITG